MYVVDTQNPGLVRRERKAANGRSPHPPPAPTPTPTPSTNYYEVLSPPREGSTFHSISISEGNQYTAIIISEGGKPTAAPTANPSPKPSPYYTVQSDSRKNQHRLSVH